MFQEQLSAPAVLTMNGLAMVREKVVPPPPPAAWEEPGPSDEWVYDYYVQDDDDGAEGGEDIEGEEGGALDHRPVVTVRENLSTCLPYDMLLLLLVSFRTHFHMLITYNNMLSIILWLYTDVSTRQLSVIDFRLPHAQLHPFPFQRSRTLANGL